MTEQQALLGLERAAFTAAVVLVVGSMALAWIESYRMRAMLALMMAGLGASVFVIALIASAVLG